MWYYWSKLFKNHNIQTFFFCTHHILWFFFFAHLTVSLWGIEVKLTYRWFWGYGLLEKIPHLATVNCAFCKQFLNELTAAIFEHILWNSRCQSNGSPLSTGSLFSFGFFAPSWTTILIESDTDPSLLGIDEFSHIAIPVYIMVIYNVIFIMISPIMIIQ